MFTGTPLALAQTLIPENAENCLSYSVLNYLKRLKNQAKVEYDRLCNEIIQRQGNVSNSLIHLLKTYVLHKSTNKSHLIKWRFVSWY